MQRQEFVIGGFTERADRTDGIGALLLGYHEEVGGPLHYAGRVGTGWDDKTMRELRGRLDERPLEEPAFVDGPRGRAARDVLWVKPELVVEVEYLTWNGTGHVRHPSFEGLRLDKPADEVVGRARRSRRARAVHRADRPGRRAQRRREEKAVKEPAGTRGGAARLVRHEARRRPRREPADQEDAD